MERKLTMEFTTSEGSTATVSFRYVSESLSTNEVKALSNAIIAASSVFKTAYATLRRASIVTTTSTDLDIE